MQKVVLFILGLLCYSLGFSQNLNDTLYSVKSQQISINALVYDFGTITQYEKAKFKFELVNTGNDVLVIKHVTTSCNCTSPSFTKKPIKPNEKASIKIKYDSSNIGSFNKSVFVYTNRQEKPMKLQIKGMVKRATSSDEKANQGVTKKTPNMQNKLPNTHK